MASLLKNTSIPVRIKPINKPTDKVILRVGDGTYSTSAIKVAHALLDPILFPNGKTPPALAASPAVTKLHAIGEKWNGGEYAGLSIADDKPVALVLLPDDEEMDWNDAMAWAGKQGGSLPSRFDQLVLLKNLKTRFQERHYWSCEQHAGYESYAWIQSVSDGDQILSRKDNQSRARVVRRLPI